MLPGRCKTNNISIHTPTKGATDDYDYPNKAGQFQSTLPRRERLTLVDDKTKDFNFNPHSHEGSDNQQHTTREYDRDFNPHSHEGSDIYRCNHFRSDYIFQSTLPRRERLESHASDIYLIVISIHTPTKGATAILTNNFLIFCSISLINFILYLQIIQILFIFRYKFIFYFIF